MSKNLKTAVAGFALAGLFVATVAVLYGAMPAAAIGGMLALTIPPALSSRNSGEQQLHCFRFRAQASNLSALTAGLKIGRLPARAFIHGIQIHTVTAFNGVTTDTLSLGTTAATGTEICAAQSVHAAAAAAVAVPFAGSGLAVTASGEVDLYVKYANTGGVATAGDATIVITYFPDNDQ